MSDKGIRVQVDTQELDPKDAGDVMLLKGKMGWFIFADQPIQEEDVKDLPEVKVEKGEKTPSQRLRGVLFLLWNQTKSTLTFDQFYRDYLNKVIEKLKEQLD